LNREKADAVALGTVTLAVLFLAYTYYSSHQAWLRLPSGFWEPAFAVYAAAGLAIAAAAWLWAAAGIRTEG